MYCDYILNSDCENISYENLYKVLCDGLYCLFDEGFITDEQLDNLLIVFNSNFNEFLCERR